jgi:lipocalin-like protein
MQLSIMTNTSGNLENAIQGTWWLLSREDYTKDGQKRTEPILGSDPIAILVYAKNYFAAQFMKKDRSAESITHATIAGNNNTAAIGGYDAYFGTYQIDEKTNQVAHTLIGSINPANIGITVYRNLRVEEDILIIKLDTTTQEGEPVIRTLTWKRVN